MPDPCDITTCDLCFFIVFCGDPNSPLYKFTGCTVFTTTSGKVFLDVIATVMADTTKLITQVGQYCCGCTPPPTPDEPVPGFTTGCPAGFLPFCFYTGEFVECICWAPGTPLPIPTNPNPPPPPPTCPPPGLIGLVNGVPVCMMDPPTPNPLPMITPFRAWTPLREKPLLRRGHAAKREFSHTFKALDPTRYRGIPHVFKSCGCTDSEAEFSDADV